MIDYLYQLDYEFKSGSANGIVSADEHEPNHAPEPKLPVGEAWAAAKVMPVTVKVAEAWAVAEAMPVEEVTPTGEPMPEEEVEWVEGRPNHKKHKKRYPKCSFQDCDTSQLFDAGPAHSDESVHKSKETGIDVHAQMYALADKYGIHDLKDLAREKFAVAASIGWHENMFATAVQTVYSSTPDSDHGLRDVVVETIRKHKELLRKAEIKILVREVDGLAYDLLKSEWGFK
jgi:hypothetical protein